MKDKYILTAESVTAGHPDKLCDTIADNVLDACLKEDPNARVACEVLATAGKILVAGELRTTASPDVETIVRQTVQNAGYDCNYHVEVRLHTQSPDIAEAVDGETLGAAHELRTPLALMQAQLELFSAEHTDVLPETAEFLLLLREQTERLTQMTKTLLEMSNLQQVARNEQIQLIPMIEEIFTDLAPLAEKRGVTLKAEGDGVMTGSDALIYRLIFNLTENAVKYNRPGGSVRVSVTQEPEKLLLRVSDTGRGIPEEFQRSIFQPFFRVDKSRSREYGGVGLGLSLVWEIADLHGGSVWVEESSDKGTTIAVELPIQ